jgi:calcyphosin
MQRNATNMHEVQYMQKTFKYFDIANRGKVTFEQFYRAMEKLGVTMSQEVSLIYLTICQNLKTIFNAVDVDGNGELDFKEFSTGFFQEELQPAYADGDPYIKEKSRQLAANVAARKDSPEALLALFRDKLKARGPRGVIGLKRLFSMMDDDGSQSLSLPAFIKTCRDFRIGISEENVPVLFGHFDRNGDGTISFQEFLEAARGPFAKERHDACVKAFRNLESTHGSEGRVPIERLRDAFDVSRHPDVVQGLRTEQSVVNEFLETFEANHQLYAAMPNEQE